MERRHALSVQLQLEIESFYLFAKIMLDKVAHAIEFYFGPAHKLPLDSHDDLVTKLTQYCSNRGLQPNPILLKIAAGLKERISDFRDYQIAHEKSPRTMWVLGWSSADDLRMGLTRLNPTLRDSQRDSTPLRELARELNSYLDALVDFLSNNRDRTNLKVKGSAPGAT
jgi:hypothetical protein